MDADTAVARKEWFRVEQRAACENGLQAALLLLAADVDAPPPNSESEKENQ